MKIGFDFDDVIYNFSQLYREEVLAKYKHDIEPQWKDGITTDIPGVDEATAKKFMYNCMKYRMSKGTETPGAIEALHKIFALTKEPIHIITSRPRFVKDSTERWLDKNLDVEYTVDYSNVKPKSFYLKERGITVFIDDRVSMLDELHKTGVLEHYILYNRPWNKNKKINFPVKRVNNLMEVYSFLQNLEGQINN